MKMILDLFAGGHSVTCYKDANSTTFSASSTSDVQKDAEVTLTVTPASGYEVDEIEVVSGGVTVELDDGTYGFTMGEENVVLLMKTKANNKYMVTEETSSCVNDTKVTLHANTVIELTPNGAIKGVSAANGGASLTVDAGIQQLIDAGVVVKI